MVKEGENMRAIGIIRIVDELGRIVLPKEIRRANGITDGTPMEIYTTSEGILLKKYITEEELMSNVRSLSEAIDDCEYALGENKVSDIRKHIEKIMNILK